MSGDGEWQPIDLFSPTAVDQILIACGISESVREMRGRLGDSLRSEGFDVATVDRVLDFAETRIRDLARAQAEVTVASAKARLLRGEENVRTQ